MEFPQTILDALREPEITFAAQTKNGLILSRESGISPMMRLLLEEPGALEGALVADRVIGRAAAFLLIVGKAAGLYGQLISLPAENLLRQHAFPYQCGERTPYIRNRSGDGMCPMEQSVLAITDPAQAMAVLTEKWTRMQNTQR